MGLGGQGGMELWRADLEQVGLEMCPNPRNLILRLAGVGLLPYLLWICMSQCIETSAPILPESLPH